MGMDLIPNNDDCPPFHFNWSGWTVIGELLGDTGVDTSDMSGTNDGEYVSERTAVRWADALDGVLGEIVVVEVPDSSYSGGSRRHFRVLAAQLREPTQPVTAAIEALYNSDMRHLFAERIKELRAATPTVHEPEPHELDWLRRFIAFLRDCGGFYQY